LQAILAYKAQNSSYQPYWLGKMHEITGTN
jgi:hypothetical protein